MQQDISRRWIVMKFGGTSVSKAEFWETIASQAQQRSTDGWHTLIVVSALSGVTDLLTRLAKGCGKTEREEVLKDIEGRHVTLFASLGLQPGDRFLSAWQHLLELAGQHSADPDASQQARILACGERLSSALGQQALQHRDIDTHLHDATELLTADGGYDDSPLSASCGAWCEPQLEAALAAKGAVHITQGFLAAGPQGGTWLLGRGGSDTSAACLASRLSAEKLEIWTDVPGIFTADPRVVPHAYLLQRLSFSEAQELASMGARILHPPSVRICKQAAIPLQIRDTGRPEIVGTYIEPRSAATDAQVKGIVSRRKITLVMMDNPSMWRQVGFLAEAFELFRKHGLSIDLVSTSESSVTVSLDPARPGVDNDEVLAALLKDLSVLCDVQLRTNCVSISLVGNAIRTILGRLSEALDVFQDRKVHMVTQSANDLNLTLVVDAEHADRLVQKLHELLISPQVGQRPEFGDSWMVLTGPARKPAADPWWRTEASRLGQLMGSRPSAFVYHLESIRNAAQALQSMNAVSRILYAMKANDHPSVLRTLHAEGTGFDCVSVAEIHHLRSVIPALEPGEILFTPNFAGRDEYREALEMGVQVTIDNIHPLLEWTELFVGHEVFLRVDLDVGHGHHKKVITSGSHSKFGIAIDQLAELQAVLEANNIRVTGLHAHTGSGVNDATVWGEQLQRMFEVAPLFPSVRVLDLGGGLGVPDRIGQPMMDIQRVDQLLGETIASFSSQQQVEVWLEPGRYLVAAAGVLLARVTQLKSKGQYHYLGLEVGMNTLIRPALYGAYHEIVNLSRLDEPAVQRVNVVGPICESGDILGESRFLPNSEEGDIMLIANAGAYGRVMSSHYNRREPAVELIFEDEV